MVQIRRISRLLRFPPKMWSALTTGEDSFSIVWASVWPIHLWHYNHSQEVLNFVRKYSSYRNVFWPDFLMNRDRVWLRQFPPCPENNYQDIYFFGWINFIANKKTKIVWPNVDTCGEFIPLLVRIPKMKAVKQKGKNIKMTWYEWCFARLSHSHCGWKKGVRIHWRWSRWTGYRRPDRLPQSQKRSTRRWGDKWCQEP